MVISGDGLRASRLRTNMICQNKDWKRRTKKNNDNKKRRTCRYKHLVPCKDVVYETFMEINFDWSLVMYCIVLYYIEYDTISGKYWQAKLATFAMTQHFGSNVMWPLFRFLHSPSIIFSGNKVGRKLMPTTTK